MTEMTGRSVLVVDDEPIMRSLLCEYLEPEGYEVAVAEDGAQAWALLQSVDRPFDVLITDRSMPNMSGMELLHRVKGDPRLKDMPVIFQTALVSRDEVLEGIRSGAYHYLTKPYDPQIFLTLVAEAVEDSRRYARLREATWRQREALDLLRRCEFQCRNMRDVECLTPLLAQLCPDPDRVVTGLSELLLNAIEHGNLGITYQEKSELLAACRWQEEIERRLQLPENREKVVSVCVERSPGEVSIVISDQGGGFDPRRYLDFDPDRVTHAHGRGIAMSRLLSFDSLEYQGCGNRVVAKVSKRPGG